MGMWGSLEITLWGLCSMAIFKRSEVSESRLEEGDVLSGCSELLGDYDFFLLYVSASFGLWRRPVWSLFWFPLLYHKCGRAYHLTIRMIATEPPKPKTNIFGNCFVTLMTSDCFFRFSRQNFATERTNLEEAHERLTNASIDADECVQRSI